MIEKTQINVGEVIICPRCRIQLFQFKKPLMVKEKLSVDHVEPLRDDALASGQTLQCPKCQTFYMDNGAVSLQSGWFPYDPTVVSR